MHAVILAGGKGRRLKPYTTVFPKPLMPLGDYPILEVVIRQLHKCGYRKLTLCVGYQHELFRAFFGEGEKWGVELKYVLEDQPLGTAGPLKLIDDLPKHFLLMNGDILTDLDFAEPMCFHREGGNAATILTHERSVDVNYGTLEYDEAGILHSYTEKPSLKYHVSMGVYVLSRETVECIPRGQAFDFPDLINALLKQKSKVVCYPYGGYWQDIGRPDDYEQAVNDFENLANNWL